MESLAIITAAGQHHGCVSQIPFQIDICSVTGQKDLWQNDHNYLQGTQSV